MNHAWAVTTLNLGRWLLSAFFILTGLAKLGDYPMYSAMVEQAGLNVVPLVLPATIVLEVCGGLILGLGRKWAWQAALVLAGFTLATNVFFHDFWTVSEDMRQIQLSLFVKNAAIFGALLAIAAERAQANSKAA